MQNNYYLIPIKCEYTYLNGFNLHSLYKNTFKTLYELEKDAENKDGVDESEEYLGILNDINICYNMLNIPIYLVAEESDGKVYEYNTRAPITSEKPINIEIYKVPYDVAADYYNKFNYQKKLANLFSHLINSSDKEMKLERKQ